MFGATCVAKRTAKSSLFQNKRTHFRDDHYTTRDHIWMLSAGLRFQYGAPNAWYRPLFFSFQPSLHTGRTQGLSSSYEFTSTLGWQGEHWMFALRHG